MRVERQRDVSVLVRRDVRLRRRQGDRRALLIHVATLRCLPRLQRILDVARHLGRVDDFQVRRYCVRVILAADVLQIRNHRPEAEFAVADRIHKVLLGLSRALQLLGERIYRSHHHMLLKYGLHIPRFDARNAALAGNFVLDAPRAVQGVPALDIDSKNLAICALGLGLEIDCDGRALSGLDVAGHRFYGEVPDGKVRTLPLVLATLLSALVGVVGVDFEVEIEASLVRPSAVKL